MIRRFYIFLGLCLLLSSLVVGQDVYGYKQYMQQVAKHHPMMKQAQLRVAIGEADLLNAKAVNDPYVEANYGDKAYDGKDYYEKSEIKFAVPTAIGLEIFSSYSENTGPRVNPELITTASGQYQIGVGMPIGSRLFFNERQMAIKQSELMLDIAGEEKRKMINDLLYRANVAYINWALSGELLQVHQNALEVARSQFDLIKEVFIQGDRPAIDTVEAFLQVQNRQFRLLNAQNQNNSARLLLSTFLWDSENNPVELIEGYQAEPLTSITSRLQVVEDSFVIWNESIFETHPDLRIAQYDIDALQFAKQTATSELFPQIELKYALLTPGVSRRDIGALGFDDRMFGVGLKYPILQRKQRSQLRLAEAKTADQSFNLDIKQLTLRAKLNQSIYAYRINREQNTLYTSMTENYGKLLSAEETKFEIGESSVFLLNSRENRLFDAQEKQLETSAKQAISALKVIETANSEATFLMLIE